MEENAGTPQIERLSAAFAACAKILTAIGDETRQHLILEMMRMGDCRGVRVGKITEKTNLSRLLFAFSFALVLSLYHFRTRPTGILGVHQGQPRDHQMRHYLRFQERNRGQNRSINYKVARSFAFWGEWVLRPFFCALEESLKCAHPSAENARPSALP